MKTLLLFAIFSGFSGLTLANCSPQQHQTISDVATIVETVDLIL